MPLTLSMTHSLDIRAVHPLHFGRGPARFAHRIVVARPDRLDDLQLFATFFAAGFVFMSVYLA